MTATSTLTKRQERFAGMPVCRPEGNLRVESWLGTNRSLAIVDGQPVNGYQGHPATHNPVGAPSS